MYKCNPIMQNNYTQYGNLNYANWACLHVYVLEICPFGTRLYQVDQIAFHIEKLCDILI